MRKKDQRRHYEESDGAGRREGPRLLGWRWRKKYLTRSNPSVNLTYGSIDWGNILRHAT